MRNSFELIAAVQEEFEGASDRAAVIVGGAILDEILRDILESFLLPQSGGGSNLFSGSGPLSTFSAKTSMAFSLGLIGRWEREKIDIIRKIRNDFAHGFDTASFSNAIIADRCRSLKVPSKMIAPILFQIPSGGESISWTEIKEAHISDPRAVFQECVLVLFGCLAARNCQAMTNRRKEPAELSGAHESLEIQRDILKAQVDKLTSLVEVAGSPDDGLRRATSLVRIFSMLVEQTKKAHGIDE